MCLKTGETTKSPENLAVIKEFCCFSRMLLLKVGYLKKFQTFKHLILSQMCLKTGETSKSLDKKSCCNQGILLFLWNAAL